MIVLFKADFLALDKKKKQLDKESETNLTTPDMIFNYNHAWFHSPNQQEEKEKWLLTKKQKIIVYYEEEPQADPFVKNIS